LGFEAANQVERGLVDRRALLVHGAGVVDDQADGDGDVGVLEAEQVLLDAVFEDAKSSRLRSWTRWPPESRTVTLRETSSTSLRRCSRRFLW
jgi:hypothetical protein